MIVLFVNLVLVMICTVQCSSAPRVSFVACEILLGLVGGAAPTQRASMTASGTAAASAAADYSAPPLHSLLCILRLYLLTPHMVGKGTVWSMTFCPFISNSHAGYTSERAGGASTMMNPAAPPPVCARVDPCRCGWYQNIPGMWSDGM